MILLLLRCTSDQQGKWKESSDINGVSFARELAIEITGSLLKDNCNIASLWLQISGEVNGKEYI